eukprot:SAG22_NODE_207_length_15278_cov_4.056855_13_plen_603_part_00
MGRRPARPPPLTPLLLVSFGLLVPDGRASAPGHFDGGLAAVLEQPTDFIVRLLHPDDLQAFYAHTWGSKPRHFARSGDFPRHNADLLPTDSSEAIAGWLKGCVSVHASTRGGLLQEKVDLTLVRQGTAPSEAILGRATVPGGVVAPSLTPEMVGAALANGFSMVVNWMQMRSPQVAQLGEAFETVFGQQVSVNMYHTPSQEQAFALHYDEEDVFVLQLSGAKRWTVNEIAVPFARGDDGGLLGDVLAERTQKLADYTLRPGDLLYIPRGTPHAARNLDTTAASTHLTVGLHTFIWQTVEGWLHRAVMHFFAAGGGAGHGRQLRLSLAKLESWTPAGNFARYDADKHLHGVEAAQQRMMAAKKARPSERGEAAAVLLHAAVRHFANSKPALRRAAVFASTPLCAEWDRAVGQLCAARASPKAKKLVAVVRGWSAKAAAKKNTSDDGLGSLPEFLNGLKASDLAAPPPLPPTVGLDAGEPRAEQDAWAERLPFSAAVVRGSDGELAETLSAAHARGVQVGLMFLRNGAGPGDAPPGAWPTVWRSFCATLQEPDSKLWGSLVAWHDALRRKQRTNVVAGSMANLEAAGLPPLRTLAPLSGLFVEE